MQNVLTAVNFNINFIYILARQEGTIYNYKVINLVKKKALKFYKVNIILLILVI